MSIWQVGDLAVCVDAGPVKDVCGDGGRETKPEYVANLVKGQVYEVTTVVTCRCGKHVGLGNHAARAGGDASRFRKVVKDKHEACEDEFITLLKRRRVNA